MCVNYFRRQVGKVRLGPELGALAAKNAVFI